MFVDIFLMRKIKILSNFCLSCCLSFPPLDSSTVSITDMISFLFRFLVTVVVGSPARRGQEPGVGGGGGGAVAGGRPPRGGRGGHTAVSTAGVSVVVSITLMVSVSVSLSISGV